ncbi:MAG: cob(I)yrinic acid a,c-diamide adenosyltransferase [Candidatus Azobacteroides sp.]|nr:cob(I)yrinic acid a,c-diamide adenosyltransferase [Candidatus Azobacteroides sp.]
MKIYTKSGDKLFTSLIGGKRVQKNVLQLDTYGSIDELNSFLGLLITQIKNEDDKNFLNFVQRKLFSLGAYFANDFSVKEKTYKCDIHQQDIKCIEMAIDLISSDLPVINKFILPGGSKSASLAHICRTICRRVERCMVSLKEQVHELEELPFIFINRLSDYLFMLARKENVRNGEEEVLW